MLQSNYMKMKGQISYYWVEQSNKICRFIGSKSNTLSYSCADVLAKLFAGDSLYTPRYVGFLYGSDPVASELGNSITRQQTWELLSNQLSAITNGGNIQISPLSLTPSISIDGDSLLYSGNSVIFYGQTRSGAESVYGFPLTTPYAGPLTTGNYLYHVVLLSNDNNIKNNSKVIARATLAEPGVGYLQKPEGFELAVEWKISFF